MNTDTGALYRTFDEIAAAQQRGEPLAMVAERVARAVRIGTQAIDHKAARKRKRQMAKASRRGNRR